MKRILSLVIAGGLGTCWAIGAAPVAPKGTLKGSSDYQDVVYFAEGRPVLLRLHMTVEGQPLSARWDELVTKIFKYLDGNGDGFLDRDEIQRIPSPAVLFGGRGRGETPTLAQLDTNGDGKVSRDELAAYYRRVGATPFQVASAADAPDQGGLFIGGLVIDDIEGFAIDGDAVITLQSGRRGNRNSDTVNDALFKLLDTNGDGKLSKAELAAAPAILLKRDRNDDEMITPDEITPGAGGRGGAIDGEGNVVIFLSGSNGYGNDRGANKGAFFQVQPGFSKTELARRLFQHYGKADKKGMPPANLSREALGLDEATFAKLDADGDGKLDSEELGRFADRSPDLELKVDLGPKASVALLKRGAALEASVKSGKEGALMLEMKGTRLDLKSLVEAKVDAAQGAKQERERYLAEFKKADKDNNGYLDMAEAMKSRLYRNVFKLMDRDGDGMLFEKEVIAYLDTYQELRTTARMASATVGISSEGKGLFELIDTDGDGRLSVRELRNAVKLIAELDRDGDGMLSRTEIPRCSQATFRLGSGQGQGGPFINEGNLVFAVDSGFGGMGRQPRQPKPARGPEWFRKMDRNGDGDVSRREFLGTDAQFKAIDADGDGLISVEEAEAYDKKLHDAAEKK